MTHQGKRAEARREIAASRARFTPDDSKHLEPQVRALERELGTKP